MRDLNKLCWGDLISDEERVAFLVSDRAYETGIISHAIVDDVVSAFEAKIAKRNCIGPTEQSHKRMIEVLRWCYERLPHPESHTLEVSRRTEMLGSIEAILREEEMKC